MQASMHMSNGLTPVQAAVLGVFESDSTEIGTSTATVIHMLPKFSPQQIREAIEFLNSEGHIYTTTDDDHYKTTSGKWAEIVHPLR